MANREREVILGAVVFVAIVVMVIGAVWLSERFAGSAGGYKLRVLFETVPGLQRGNPVTFRGVKVGKVLSIYLESGTPIAMVGFSEFKALPVDSQLLLKSEGLLGGQMIEIRLGTSAQTYKDGDTVIGISGIGIDRVIEHGGEVARQLDVALEDLTQPGNMKHLVNTIAQLDSATLQLQKMVAENRGALAGVMDSLSLASGGAKGLVEENRKGIRESVENLRAASERVLTLSQNLETSSTTLKELLENVNQVSSKISSGQGTVGKLVQDDAVYLHLERTLTSMDSLLEDIKRDPTRYFNFSVF